jgi:3-hydroxyacyl-CoA dehydrogenase/enoyl-CoA hydratase/3-hydroxybutyryl-CoA epimerase
MVEIALPAAPEREVFDQIAEALESFSDEPLVLRFSTSSEFTRDHLAAYLQAEAGLRQWCDLARRLETREGGAIAWVEQDLTGLWFEVFLACRRRLLANPKAQLCLPAMQFGLLPALGSGQRLGRLLPLADAIAILLHGTPINAESTVKWGLAQIVVRDEPASRFARGPLTRQPWDQPPGTGPAASYAEQGHILNAAFLEVRGRMPPAEAAPTALLRSLHDGLERTFEPAVKLEQGEFFRTRLTPSTQNRLRLFSIATAKARSQLTVAPPETLPTIVVIGAGLMGTGIAYTAARAGCEVFLTDQNPDALIRSFQRISKLANSSDQAAPNLIGRIHGSPDFRPLAAADIVIEAVFERFEVKAEVLREAGRLLRPGAILASNTTTLPISRLAELTPEPARFLGTHFFAPVDRMNLLEIIRGERTSDDAVARALQLASCLGKTPVIVNDGPGFFTSRVVMAYVQEAFFLLEEGADPWLIDNAALNAGMIIGPLAMADLTSLDLLRDIYLSLGREQRGAARDAPRTVALLDRMIGLGRTGKKCGAGIYDYGPRGERRAWPKLREPFPARPGGITPEIICQRLLVIQSLEAMHALKEGILADPDLGDLAAVLGWSYPPCLGGPFGYVNLVGQEVFAATCQALTAKCGERFRSPY